VKFLWLALLASIACKLLTQRWPWDFLRAGPTPSQARLRARKLLGVRQDASRQEILEAHRNLIAIVHPDRGGTNDQVHEANAARDLLIDELPEGT
jgi:DnaJ family protein C protein 19